MADVAPGFDSQYVLGVGDTGGRMLILIDIERLMASSEMALVDSVEQRN